MRGVLLIAVLLLGGIAGAEEWDYKKEILPYLVKMVEPTLKTQDPATGQFGDKPWIVNDQHVMYGLAVAWATPSPENPWYHHPRLLEAVMAAGDALIEAQDAQGKWVFRKKDGSTWGDIYMPWTYSRWVRAFGLIREAMPAERRARWETALKLGYGGIAKHELVGIQNIPAHHAMGLYRAGQLFGRADWMTSAAEYLGRVAEEQYPDGFWTENVGPVVGYNMVYVDALGSYYSMSKDRAMLPALERAARFHANFTYPDGSNVETVDERQVYHAGASMPNVGFTHTAVGRGYLQRQWELAKAQGTTAPISLDLAGSLLAQGSVGEITPVPGLQQNSMYVTEDGHAMTRRQALWFVCLSGYTAPVPKTRWIQDRQNLLSLFSDKTGLILGGGNTKLQPRWSTFTVGDPELLKHRAGEEEPDFTPPPGILHVATTSTLEPERTELRLRYGDTQCRVRVECSAAAEAKVVYARDNDSTGPVSAHMPLMPKMGKTWRTASGKSGRLSGEGWTLGAGEAGAWFEHAGWRVSVPADATLRWPVLPHNPYRKDGRAEPKEGKIVLSIPLEKGEAQEVKVSVEP